MLRKHASLLNCRLYHERLSVEKDHRGGIFFLLYAVYLWHLPDTCSGLLRFLDRVGKGIRTSPRDALLSESAPQEHRGIAFSFHRLMDHVGAVTGPLLAIVILYLLLNEQFLPFMETAPERANLFSLRVLFLISVIPGLGVLAPDFL